MGTRRRINKKKRKKKYTESKTWRYFTTRCVHTYAGITGRHSPRAGAFCCFVASRIQHQQPRVPLLLHYSNILIVASPTNRAARQRSNKDGETRDRRRVGDNQLLRTYVMQANWDRFFHALDKSAGKNTLQNTAELLLIYVRTERRVSVVRAYTGTYSSSIAANRFTRSN